MRFNEAVREWKSLPLTAGDIADLDRLRASGPGRAALAGLSGSPLDGEVAEPELLEVLNPARSPGRHPLFQALLTLQNNAPVSAALPGVRASAVRAGTPAARFDLSVILGEARDAGGAPGGLRGQLLAAADLFDAGTAAAGAAQDQRQHDVLRDGQLRNKAEQLRDDGQLVPR